MKIFQERRQSESSACRWRLRTAAKDPQLSTSVFVGVEVYVSTCVRGRCARVYVCVCVWGGCQQNTTSLLLLGLSKSHHVPGDSASGAASVSNIMTAATTTSSDSLHSQGPPQAQSHSHILSEPQSQPPGHAGCKNPIHGEGT